VANKRARRLARSQAPTLASYIPPEADLNAIAAALRGPLYFRRWFSREPIDDRFVDLIVQGILAGVRRDHPKRSEQGGRRHPDVTGNTERSNPDGPLIEGKDAQIASCYVRGRNCRPT
jgi:hypothetical protein